MMLYQGVLMYNFGKPPTYRPSCSIPKYADGLLIEHFAEKICSGEHQAPKLHRTQRDATGRQTIGESVDSLGTDLLNRLADWRKAVERLPGTATADEAINTLKRCTPLERKTLQPFSFVSKEQILNKTGKQRCVSRFCRQLAYPLHETGGGQYSDRTTTIRKKQSQPRQRIRYH